VGYYATSVLPPVRTDSTHRARRCLSFDRQTDLPSENRVWVSESQTPNPARHFESQVPETTSETTVTLTIIVSGLPFWLSRDPIGERGGLNVYRVQANNPANRVDPLGLGPIPSWTGSLEMGDHSLGFLLRNDVGVSDDLMTHETVLQYSWKGECCEAQWGVQVSHQMFTYGRGACPGTEAPTQLAVGPFTWGWDQTDTGGPGAYRVDRIVATVGMRTTCESATFELYAGADYLGYGFGDLMQNAAHFSPLINSDLIMIPYSSTSEAGVVAGLNSMFTVLGSSPTDSSLHVGASARFSDVTGTEVSASISGSVVLTDWMSLHGEAVGTVHSGMHPDLVPMYGSSSYGGLNLGASFSVLGSTLSVFSQQNAFGTGIRYLGFSGTSDF